MFRHRWTWARQSGRWEGATEKCGTERWELIEGTARKKFSPRMNRIDTDKDPEGKTSAGREIQHKETKRTKKAEPLMAELGAEEARFPNWRKSLQIKGTAP